MCKDTTNNLIEQQKTLFSLPESVLGKKIKVDFNALDISSNGWFAACSLFERRSSFQDGMPDP